jgi:multidrug efflux pump subunit AcrB
MKLPKIEKGFAGFLAETFVLSKLTPISIIVSILLGLAAIILTPKEEEPQITVPMIDVMIPAPGFSAEEVERKVVEVAERELWGIDGVEYIYSVSQPHGALVTVRFKVNEPIEPSLVKIHHKMLNLKQVLPKNVLPASIKSYTIDDVPFLVATFSSDKRDDYEIRSLVAPIARKISATSDIANIELLGGRKRALRVIANAQKLGQYGVTLEDIFNSLERNHVQLPAGKNWGKNQSFDITIGSKLTSKKDILNLAIGSSSGSLVRISDVAQVIDGPEQRSKMSVIYNKEQKINGDNAVSISLAKRKGTNVVVLADHILKQIDEYKKDLPADIKLTVMRNYGQTANAKTIELIEHLLLATISVTILIALAMGFRAALVVAIAIPVTLALTLALYYFMGYTLNRITLFALIFSIGILVDDAIVVVENIERYLKTYKKLSLVQATLRAVSEVGNPTVLATITVIASILPMAFVRGLMGPYMKPIPVGASIAMILSLFIAFMVTPWASVKLLKHEHDENDDIEDVDEEDEKNYSKLDKIYVNITSRLLDSKKWALGFVGATLLLLFASMALVATKQVKVKMLPFDDKNEFQVNLDYPPLTPIENSTANSQQLAQELLKHEDVLGVQIFAGQPAPYSFSGMVKHTYLRHADYMNDLLVILKDKHDRSKSSHVITNELRPIITKFSKKFSAVSKVLEVPPGPPVMATMVAEVYGKDRESLRIATLEMEKVFRSDPSFVDIDTTLRAGRSQLIIPYDYKKASNLGTVAYQSWSLGRLIFNETSMGSINDLSTPESVSIDLSMDQKIRTGENPFGNQYFPSFSAGTIKANDVLGPPQLHSTRFLHRKNLHPVEYVTSELAGADEAPVYGMLNIADRVPYKSVTTEIPWDTSETIVKWDGEWFITYEVFRDLGAAFAAVLILIYILVVGWFKSFTVPFVIMAPIPISLIGILPGHWSMGVYFTATSMIGFIAGGGVIVRNSIILVDFIEHQIKNGKDLKDAVISAGVLRFRPMLLTASAVVVGSSIMLFDPIFQGLAVSMIFGEIAATLISRFVVPLTYYWGVGKSRMKQLTKDDTKIDMWGNKFEK